MNTLQMHHITDQFKLLNMKLHKNFLIKLLHLIITLY